MALHGGGDGDGVWPAVMGPHLHFCSGHSKKCLMKFLLDFAVLAIYLLDVCHVFVHFHDNW